VVVAPPRRLAVHRQDGLLHAGLGDRLGAQRPQPVGEACLEGGRLQRHQDAAEDILARGAVGQVEHPREEFLRQGRPAGDRGRPAGAGEHRQQRDDDHAGQGVPLIDVRTRVLQLLEVDDDLVQRDTSKVSHIPPRAALSWKHTGGGYTRRPPKAQASQLARTTYKCALALSAGVVANY
jgi:hypothetical protein